MGRLGGGGGSRTDGVLACFVPGQPTLRSYQYKQTWQGYHYLLHQHPRPPSWAPPPPSHPLLFPCCYTWTFLYLSGFFLLSRMKRSDPCTSTHPHYSVDSVPYFLTFSTLYLLSLPNIPSLSSRPCPLPQHPSPLCFSSLPLFLKISHLPNFSPPLLVISLTSLSIPFSPQHSFVP